MYRIIRQKRKSLTLQITDTLEVVVKAPYYVSEQEIERFVTKYQEWIEKARLQKQQVARAKDWLVKKECIYLGEHKKIQIIETRKGKSCVESIDDLFVISIPDKKDDTQIRQVMNRYWKCEALRLFTSLTHKYCEKLGCQYQRITVRNQKTRWGSCSAQGNLSYNMRLLSAPIEVIEYVILHEVVHLRYFNHSQTFWQEVAKYMPNYKVYQQYLKENGAYLGI